MTVRQIENALALLEFFAARGASATQAEIQAHFEWPRSSTYNILGTLVARGYMHEPARRGAYYPTRRWLDIATALADADPLNALLKETLVDLVEETGETAIVAAPAGRHSVYIDVAESLSAVRYAARAGMRVPIHAGATGRALLSCFSEAERKRVLAAIDYTRYGEGALVSPDTVEKEISESIKRGWFQSLHEYDADLAAVALPLVIADRRLALAVAGPVSRLGARCADVAESLSSRIAALRQNAA
ncbi:MAG: IclR family transcriptional regulator [Pseudomonadota bacterium]